MKSGKQKRQEIRQKRLERARKLQHIDYTQAGNRPGGSVLADPGQLTHNNPFDPLPAYYMDRPFRCRDCGSEELWTAKQQKWWYEIAKGNIYSTAIRCRRCRKKESERKAVARQVHLEGLAKKN